MCKNSCLQRYLSLILAVLLMAMTLAGLFVPKVHAAEPVPYDQLVRIKYGFNDTYLTAMGVGQQIQTQPLDASNDGQVFRVHFHNADTVSLFTMEGYVVDVEGSSRKNYGKIIVSDSRSDTKASQKWKLQQKDGAVVLENCRSHKVMNVFGRTSEWLIQFEDDGTPAVLFTLEAYQDPIVRIQFAGSGRVLDVPAERVGENANALQLWSMYEDNVNQMFRLHYVGDDMYQLYSLADGKVVEVARSRSAEQCAPVQTYSAHSYSCACWTIIANDDGTFTFRNAADGQNLNIDKGRGEQGAKVQLYTPDGTIAERFNILELDGTPICPEHVQTASSPADDMISNMLAIARAELGNGGERYLSWYPRSLDDPWCATFSSWCAAQAGLLEAGALPKTASCPTAAEWFQQRGAWVGPKGTPVPGAWVFYKGENGGVGHVGIVESVTKDDIHTIEGNWKHKVSAKTVPRGSSDIVGYGLPVV